MTNNNKGMEMSTLSPLFEEWVQSYDGEHPLVDLGCAFGRNVSAAATRLAEWPGSQGINHQEIMASASLDEQLCGMPNKQLPTYYHPIAAKDLARACERAGLEVVLAREQFHPGWPSACPYDGRENAQVVARKKN